MAITERIWSGSSVTDRVAEVFLRKNVSPVKPQSAESHSESELKTGLNQEITNNAEVVESNSSQLLLKSILSTPKRFITRSVSGRRIFTEEGKDKANTLWSEISKVAGEKPTSERLREVVTQTFSFETSNQSKFLKNWLSVSVERRIRTVENRENYKNFQNSDSPLMELADDKRGKIWLSRNAKKLNDSLTRSLEQEIKILPFLKNTQRMNLRRVCERGLVKEVSRMRETNPELAIKDIVKTIEKQYNEGLTGFFSRIIDEKGLNTVYDSKRSNGTRGEIVIDPNLNSQRDPNILPSGVRLDTEKSKLPKIRGFAYDTFRFIRRELRRSNSDLSVALRVSLASAVSLPVIFYLVKLFSSAELNKLMNVQ